MTKHLRSRKRNNKSLRRSLRKNTKRRSRNTKRRKNSKRRSTRRKRKHRKLKGGTRSSLTLTKSDLQDFTFIRDRKGNLVIQSISHSKPEYVQLMNYSKGSGEYPKVIQIMKGEEIIMEEGAHKTNKEFILFRDSITDKDVITLEIEDHRKVSSLSFDFSNLEKQKMEKLKKEPEKHPPKKMKKPTKRVVKETGPRHLIGENKTVKSESMKEEETSEISKDVETLISELRTAKGREITEAEIDTLIELLDIEKSIEEIHAKLKINDFDLEITSSELKEDLE
jgi:hypothetical protein